MSSSNGSLLAATNAVKESMALCTQIWSYCFLVFGIIGQGLNLYVFTRQKFRQNPCARYFLAATISGYTVVCFNIPLRLFQTSYQIDLFAYSNLSCQILAYVLVWNKVLPSWFMVLASVDRYLCSSSSVRLRQWSSIRVANCSILVITLFIILIHLHIPFNYTISLSQRLCTIASNSYRTFIAIWNLFVWSWIPSALMLIFGLLIVRHIRQGKRRIGPRDQRQRHRKKSDRQLIQMLLIQSLMLALTTTIGSVGNLYVSITSILKTKNMLDLAIDTYVLTVANYVAMIGSCLSFYIFTLSSRLFRNELLHLFHTNRPRPATNILNGNIPLSTLR